LKKDRNRADKNRNTTKNNSKQLKKALAKLKKEYEAERDELEKLDDSAEELEKLEEEYDDKVDAAKRSYSSTSSTSRPSRPSRPGYGRPVRGGRDRDSGRNTQRTSKASAYKRKIDDLQDEYKDFLKEEARLRGAEQAVLNKAKAECTTRLRARVAELGLHPGVKDMLRCTILMDSMDKFLSTADLLTTAGNTEKAAEYNKRAALLSTQIAPLQHACLIALKENPLPKATDAANGD